MARHHYCPQSIQEWTPYLQLGSLGLHTFPTEVLMEQETESGATSESGRETGLVAGKNTKISVEHLLALLTCLFILFPACSLNTTEKIYNKASYFDSSKKISLYLYSLPLKCCNIVRYQL